MLKRKHAHRMFSKEVSANTSYSRCRDCAETSSKTVQNSVKAEPQIKEPLKGVTNMLGKLLSFLQLSCSVSCTLVLQLLQLKSHGLSRNCPCADGQTLRFKPDTFTITPRHHVMLDRMLIKTGQDHNMFAHIGTSMELNAGRTKPKSSKRR